MVVGVDVEPPEQLFLPRRQRLGADRLDVGEGQQAEHLQPLFDADQRGELPDDLGILGVAAERDHATSAGGCAIRNSTSRARLGRRARAARTCCARHPHALGGVVLVAPFADVVAAAAPAPAARAPRDRASSAAKRSRLGVAGVGEPLEVPDGQQRVLVDRVLVVEVAHHAAGDRLELAGTSGRAGRSRASPTAARRGPAAASGTRSSAVAMRRRRKEVLGAKPLGVLLDAAPAPRRRRRQSCVDRRLEGGAATSPAARPPRRASMKRMPSRDATRFDADRHRRGLAAPTRATRVDDARVPEVVAHQPLDALAAAAAPG